MSDCECLSDIWETVHLYESHRISRSAGGAGASDHPRPRWGRNFLSLHVEHRCGSKWKTEVRIGHWKTHLETIRNMTSHQNIMTRHQHQHQNIMTWHKNIMMTWHDNIMMKDMSKTVLGCSLARTRGPTTSPPVYGMADLWEIRQSFSKLVFTQFKSVFKLLMMDFHHFKSLKTKSSMSVSEFLSIEIFWVFELGKGVSLLRYFIQAAWNLRREPHGWSHGWSMSDGPRIDGAAVGGGQRRWSPWRLGPTLD